MSKEEIKVYGFGISEVDAMKNAEALKAAKGLIGVHIHPQGLLVIFWTENDAKICRNIMEFAGCRVGKRVVEVFIPKEEAGQRNAD